MLGERLEDRSEADGHEPGKALPLSAFSALRGIHWHQWRGVIW
jgi:hypothetical protein